MDRKKLSPWILVSAALAFVLLLCDANLLTLDFTSKPLLPTVLSVLPPIGDWMGLPEVSSALGILLLLAMPPAVFVANLTILIIAHKRRWRPRWLAWVAFSVPAAMWASLLMVPLMVVTVIFPWGLAGGLAGAVFGWVMLRVAKRRGWRLLWPWWVILLCSGSYIFLVLLGLVLAFFDITQPPF